MSENQVFKAHPRLDCYFETSDGLCFFTENAAASHALALKDKKLKKVCKKTVENEVEKENETENVEVFEEKKEPEKEVTNVEFYKKRK